MSFVRDKRDGENFEVFVCKTLLDKFDLMVHKNSLIEGIDLVGEKKIEVKLDRQYKETGNFFIEFSNNGKNSGIQKYADCDYFIVGDEDFFIICKPKNLAEFCRKRGKPINCGDGWKSKGYLINVEEISMFADMIYKKEEEQEQEKHMYYNDITF